MQYYRSVFQHLRKLLVRLLKVPELRNLKKDLNRLRESGEINRKEKLTLLRKWKNKHWRSQAQKKKVSASRSPSYDFGFQAASISLYSVIHRKQSEFFFLLSNGL